MHQFPTKCVQACPPTNDGVVDDRRHQLPDVSNSVELVDASFGQLNLEAFNPPQIDVDRVNFDQLSAHFVVNLIRSFDDLTSDIVRQHLLCFVFDAIHFVLSLTDERLDAIDVVQLTPLGVIQLLQATVDCLINLNAIGGDKSAVVSDSSTS